MTTVHHVNGGTLLVAGYPPVPCRCLLLADADRLALVDAGIGLLDVRDPGGRLGRDLIAAAGFQFDEADPAARRVEALGFRAADVTDIVLTHGDPDHAGGLADFPHARVHVSAEEHARIAAGGHPRYAAAQFAHGPAWVTHPPSRPSPGRRW